MDRVNSKVSDSLIDAIKHILHGYIICNKKLYANDLPLSILTYMLLIIHCQMSKR